MDPMWLLVIAAGGSCAAALASAGVAVFSYRAEQQRSARAELFVRPERAHRLVIGPAEVHIRLWNEGQGVAENIEIEVHPTGAPAIVTPLNADNSDLPQKIGPGDEFPVKVELPLSGTDIHTLILSWEDSGTGQRRHRYSTLDPSKI